MKIVVNPTWECNLQCSYCWCRALGWDGQSPVLYWKAWAKWLMELPRPSIVDFSGGEPTLYPDLPKLVELLSRNRIGWALTTNLTRMSVVERLLESPLCAAIHVSIHRQSPGEIRARIGRLRQAGHNIWVSRVMHNDAPEANWASTWLTQIPFQDFSNGTAIDGKHRLCSAGVKHLVCDPSGNVYRCAVYMQRGLPPMGQVTTPAVELALKGPAPCSVGCTTCYTADPSAWEVEMWP